MLILLSIGIDNISIFEDFDFFWDFWNDLVFVVLNIYVFKVNCKYVNCFLWIISELVKVINKKKILWRCIKKLKIFVKMEKFCKLRQYIKNWICFERRNYIKIIVSEIYINFKCFWIFFFFKNKRKFILEKVIYNNFIFFDDRVCVEVFNVFFKFVFKDYLGCKVNLEEFIIFFIVSCFLCYI